jgi:glycosidase
MWGGDDPDDRKPMVWPDMKFADETHHPFGKHRERDKVRFDSSLFNYYSRLVEIRKSNKALSVGEITFLNLSNNPFVVSYKRKLNNDSLIVIANNNIKSVAVSYSNHERKSAFADLISNNKFGIENGRVNIILKPYQTIILK